MDEELLVKQAKTIERIDSHFDFLERLDRKKRNNHGKNNRFSKIKEELKLLKNLIIGQGCEFYDVPKNWCPLLNEVCDVINKPKCPVRLKKLEEEKNQTEYLINTLTNSTFTPIPSKDIQEKKGQ